MNVHIHYVRMPNLQGAEGPLINSSEGLERAEARNQDLVARLKSLNGTKTCTEQHAPQTIVSILATRAHDRW